jgi:Spx/MgsR family transcriptional regulator
MYRLYGLKNCDTCRKAAAWLEAQGKTFRFHDFRKDGLDEALLERLESTVGWETLLNRRSATWRALPEEERAALDRDQAMRLMLRYPALLKRPLLEEGERIWVGFQPERQHP